MKIRFDAETRRKLKLAKKAKRAFRKLTERGETLTTAQRMSLKHTVARALTTFPTSAEKRLKDQIGRLGFLPNQIILGFIPDFVNEARKIIAEVDGGVHERDDVKQRDKIKDQAFREANWTVLRFTNEDVNFRIEQVVEKIKEELGDSDIQ